MIEEYTISVESEIQAKRYIKDKKQREKKLNAKLNFLTSEIERVNKNNLATIFNYFYWKSANLWFLILGFITLLFSIFLKIYYSEMHNINLFHDGNMNMLIYISVLFILGFLLYLYVCHLRLKSFNTDLYLSRLIKIKKIITFELEKLSTNEYTTVSLYQIDDLILYDFSSSEMYLKDILPKKATSSVYD